MSNYPGSHGGGPDEVSYLPLVIVATVIGVFLVVDLWRGITGQGWNF